MEGDLQVQLKDDGDWKKRWFKEVRKWKPMDVDCYRAAWISVYRIPCHVTNAIFIEALLSNIGSIANFDFLERKPEGLDVLSFIVFTKSMETIRRKANIFLDGGWISLMIVEEITMKTKAGEFSRGEESSNSDFQDCSISSEQSRKVEEMRDPNRSFRDSVPKRWLMMMAIILGKVASARQG